MIPAGSSGAGTTGPQETNLRYPQERIGSDTDWVLFNFYKYKAPFSNQVATNTSNDALLSDYNSSVTSLGEHKGTIQLYMPEDIEAQYGANWQDMDLSLAARTALGMFGKASAGNIGGAGKEALQSMTTMTENAISKGTVVATAIGEILGQTNFGSLTTNDVFAASTGQILNPNTEVLYRGPKMRNFSLSFKMAPRNLKEAQTIKSIIQKFKVGTLPKFGAVSEDKSASFVSVPDIVDVTFMRGGAPSEWVSQFKPSVITDFNVSYTPDGAWARLPDGSPVATTIRISFQETKMVYGDEIRDSGATF